MQLDAPTTALMLQSLTLVWGAAKLHTAVQSLKETSLKFNETLQAVADRVNEHGEAIAALRVLVK